MNFLRNALVRIYKVLKTLYETKQKQVLHVLYIYMVSLNFVLLILVYPLVYLLPHHFQQAYLFNT